LEKLPPLTDPRVLVGFNTSDDAGVVKLTDDLALVQTVDFFTPIVDDPYQYGLIAAANALSDVYAMGGRPYCALNIVGFPRDLFPAEVLGAILQGGHDKAREAETLIVGGHTISDEELKYGLAVTGLVHPKKILTNAGARPGDALLLTKPIGTGTITTALKAGKGSAGMELRVCQVMAQLNRRAAELSLEIGVNACTDISGFGLLGHALELARASHVTLEISDRAVPVLEDAIATTAAGIFPGGSRANLLYVAPDVDFHPAIGENRRLLLCDAQTSGGLLLAIREAAADLLLKKLIDEGVTAVRIGQVIPSLDRAICVR